MMKTYVALLAVFVCMPYFTTARFATNEDVNKRVIGGFRSSLYSFAFQALIRGQDDEENCGGTLLDDQWVLTAAQCVSGSFANELNVTVGTKLRRTTGGQTKNVAKIIVHEEFNDVTLDNDIALLKLNTKVDVSKLLGYQIRLPEQGDRLSADKNPSCFLIGWGKSDNEEFPNYLRMAKLRLVKGESCQEIYQGVQNTTFNMLCAGGNGKAGCQGDLGGPLACEIKGNSKTLVLRGIASWGDEECSGNYPSVFTRVTSYVNWILLKTKCRPNPSDDSGSSHAIVCGHA